MYQTKLKALKEITWNFRGRRGAILFTCRIQLIQIIAFYHHHSEYSMYTKRVFCIFSSFTDSMIYRCVSTLLIIWAIVSGGSIQLKLIYWFTMPNIIFWLTLRMDIFCPPWKPNFCLSVSGISTFPV